MSDLISRKVVMKLIWELLEISEYDGDKIIMVKDDIEKLPTAYDVDKVVEQLKSAEYDHGDDWCKDYAVDTDTAINIVKAGGLNE